MLYRGSSWSRHANSFHGLEDLLLEDARSQELGKDDPVE
jgi:hypothetical protein